MKINFKSYAHFPILTYSSTCFEYCGLLFPFIADHVTINSRCNHRFNKDAYAKLIIQFYNANSTIVHLSAVLVFFVIWFIDLRCK